MANIKSLKQAAAKAAIQYVQEDSVIGVGTGSTVNFFIEELALIKNRFRGAVSSSNETTQCLRQLGIEVFDMNSVADLSLYVDGADEVDSQLNLIKGGGAALTGEKIIATLARQFVCIVDESKQVESLGRFALPLEVIPMARSHIARQIVAHFQAEPVYREGVVTDYGNVILDVHNLDISDPLGMEQALNQLAGVVTNGIFAQRKADIVLLAGSTGVRSLTA